MWEHKHGGRQRQQRLDQHQRAYKGRISRRTKGLKTISQGKAEKVLEAQTYWLHLNPCPSVDLVMQVKRPLRVGEMTETYIPQASRWP